MPRRTKKSQNPAVITDVDLSHIRTLMFAFDGCAEIAEKRGIKYGSYMSALLNHMILMVEDPKDRKATVATLLQEWNLDHLDVASGKELLKSMLTVHDKEGA